MTSDRRWGSARRGGMTVLGKVAVPKPINLPSQRLENHGLDPNVEIVPKGTLSWGSRPSSSGSNAWGTPALSPTTDVISSSPSHLVGRPSSSGGTRPSTSGSERAHDSNVNAWSSNSRPSSASGVLASTHASSTSLRPLSAETRPGSSHLSRFAESAPEGSGVGEGTGMPERKGVASSANDGFSLSSGDFPTLGSERDESKRNLDHLEPPASSGGVRTMDDGRGNGHGDISRNPDIGGNSWKQDGPPFVEDGPRPSMERWHGEHHLYPNPDMAPHYESWRGTPPVNPPGGGWYRGPPGPPYSGPVPPGSFPIEPYPYYHPHAVAPGLASSQPIPPGVGHHGHHPKNAEMPPMPHAPHLHPGMPMRPGFYPGPVPYDIYYRPPQGFCNPNERDVPLMGMPPGPPAYTRHANQYAPDPAHPRSRESRGLEQVEPGHSHDPRGNKVLVNPNDSWNQNQEEKWGHRVTAGAINREKGILSRAPLKDNASEDDYKKNEVIHYGKSAILEVSSHSSDHKFSSADPSGVKSPDCLSKIDEPQMCTALDNVTSPSDHSLIQKIEGLNAKALAAGGEQDGFHREEPNDRVQMVSVNDHRSANEVNSEDVLECRFPSEILIPDSCSTDISSVNRSKESSTGVTPAPRWSVRGARSRNDPQPKGRFRGQEADGWGKKCDSQSFLGDGSRSVIKNPVEEHNVAVQVAEVSRVNFHRKDGDVSVGPSIHHGDMQRSKIRELAKQRTIQLQKEEEERVREQKAKALAKLEELNKRRANQGVEIPTDKESSSPPDDVPKKRDVSGHQPAPSLDANHSSGSSAAPNSIGQINEHSTNKILGADVSSGHLMPETKGNVCPEDSLSSQDQLPTTVYVDDESCHRPAHQVCEISKQKRGGYQQRQNVAPEKDSVQYAIPAGRTDPLQKDLKVSRLTQEGTSSFVDSGVRKLQAESTATAELPVQKRKTNKSGRNRHKVESFNAISSSVTIPKNPNCAQAIAESAKQNASSLHVNPISMQLLVDPKDAIQLPNYQSSLSRENTHDSAWKPQDSRKPRNSQVNRTSEKNHSNDNAVWAPVRVHNKLDVTDQTSQKEAEPSLSSAIGDNPVHNGSKTKRAEMERYVPKPVSNELTQQGIIQHPSSIDPAATEGGAGSEKTCEPDSVLKEGTNLEFKHVDEKNRNKRGQGSWRQRVSAGSVKASRDFSAANAGKNIQTSNKSHSNTKDDKYFERRPSFRPDEHSRKIPQASMSDGWDSVNDFSSDSAFTGLKDHLPAEREKGHPRRGQKGSGSHPNRDHKEENARLSDLQYSLEANQAEKTMSLKENCGAGDRSVTHWQPKSQGHVTHSQPGNSSRGGQNFSEDKKALESDTGPNDCLDTQSLHKTSAAKDLVLASEDKVKRQTSACTELVEAKRDKRAAPTKGRPHSPNQDTQPSGGDVDPASFGAIDGCNEKRPSSGHHKNASYSGRFNRGRESFGDRSSTTQESKQHHSLANQERPRRAQNSHYEYQPVGPHNGSNRSNESGVQTESQSEASRFREKGQSHSRRGRGNFYGRQSSNERLLS
ncbi:unnamed protein product [Amaranthus hypochondriacus]